MVGALVAVSFALGVLVSSAGAAGAPSLSIHSLALPTFFSASDTAECLKEERVLPPCDTYQITVTDSGSKPTVGPIAFTDTLPAGVTVEPSVYQVQFFLAKNQEAFESESPRGSAVGSCEVKTTSVTVVKCEDPDALAPDQRLEMDMFLTVEAGAVSAVNKAEVSEAGTVVAVSEGDDEVGASEAPFGPSGLVSQLSGFGGAPDTQAGDHPYELATRIDLNTKMGNIPETSLLPTTVGKGVRDIVVDLPPGVLGNATTTPKCTFGQLQAFPQSCPLGTMVGHISTEPESSDTANAPIFNMVPQKGVAAEFAFTDALFNTHVIVASLAPTPAGYVLRATAHEIPDVDISDVITTFYGDPAEHFDQLHPVCTFTGNEASKYQTSACTEENAEHEGNYELMGTAFTPVPFFTTPSDCSGQPLDTTIYADSWEHPGTFNVDGTPDVEGPGSEGWAKMVSESPPVSGCDLLRFDPEAFSAQPDTSAADTATGLSMDLKVPQSEQPQTLATPPLRDTTVTLPAGLIPNPAFASGLVGCSEAQIGWLGHSPSELTEFSPQAPSCPNESKIGSVEVTTPLLEKPLVGSLYLARQNENPFASILAGYIVIDDPTTGIIVKIPGKLTLNPATGQVTGVFNEAPQAPFSELKLRFFGGSTGELATPVSCGTYTTTGQLTPWSAPQSGTPAEVSDSFQVNTGCTPGFAPAFAAGTTSPQAGSYSPFTLSFSRQDQEQEISGLTVSLPPGVTAKIAGVAKCSDAEIQAAANNPSGASEAASPSCPAASEVGTVQAGSGVGPEPLSLSGKAYLTGPYKGAPLGLAVIVPALAGPFDLGNVVVRTALYINPNDTHVTAVSDPLPTIVDATGADGVTDGFPDRIKTINVTLNRNTYILNPTNCNPTSINATFTSTSGATSPASQRFQVGGCRELPFKPSFTVSTQGHASKAAGASLHVHVTSAPGQANIAKVKTDLPKQLPSWLPTLQKACLAATFATNPASCPEGSLVGTATAVSPLIAAPFTGPAYLVSHGGAAFPDLEIVLQAEGITIVLDGKTDIKKGITISDFETVPDQPVSSFELTLPMGPHHVLATNVPEKLNHNLCGQTLNMPTLITGQNGATVKQTTKISIMGCAKKKQKKHKKPTKYKKHKH